MDIKQEFREEKNMDVYAMNVNDGSFSNVYVKWLEAKINYTRCCTELCDCEEPYNDIEAKQCMGCGNLVEYGQD
ncbi:MAG: hypothetical protein ACJAVA_000219 [Flavobacteriaceae bacterium]|jgi:hypothetical protein